jgi:hypothetical protein
MTLATVIFATHAITRRDGVCLEIKLLTISTVVATRRAVAT